MASAAVVAGVSVGISLGATPVAGSAGQAAVHAGLGAVRTPSASAAALKAGRSGKPDSGTAVSQKAASGKPASGKPASGKAVSGHPARPKSPAVAAGKSAAPHRQATVKKAPASKPKPYLIYDSVVPETIPAGQVVATYATGARPDSPSQVAGRRTVIWIDTLATDPAAQALDIEPGAASPSQAASWVDQRLTAQPHATAILYMSISEWSTVQADVAALPSWMRARIRWWIADPTGSPHIVPGSQATQWYWGSSYDISTALPGF